MKLILFFVLIVSPQAFSNETQDQFWNSTKISSKINDRVALKGELIHRYSEDSSSFVTRSNRLGLGYKFSEKTNYTFLLENRRGSSRTSNEIRFINELTHQWKLERLKLAARGRWELREFSNTPEFAHRLRGRVKLDGTDFQFYNVTPYVAAEYFYGLNEVKNRPKNEAELRLYVGGSFKMLGGSISISYLRREIRTPAFQGSSKSVSKYNILDTGFSWAF